MKSCVLVKVSKQTLSFWYQIEGGDYATLSLKEGNVIPLCFYVNGNEFNVGSFAKERCLVNDPNAYTDYFENVKNPSNHFSLVGDSKPYKLLLYFGIENYLSHFIKTGLYKSESIEAYREIFCLRFWFDDDLENSERLLVISLFKEAGYENVSSIIIDDHLKKQLSGESTKENGRIYLTAINNDLYVKLFSVKHELLGKFKLPELGSDPRAKILAKLILEDVKEANPHLFINDEVEIPYIIPNCTALLSSLSPLMRDNIQLSTGTRLDYRIKLKDLEGRLAYNRGIEDKVIPQLEAILGQNGFSASTVDLLLLGDQISTNYFKEKLTKKFPNVVGFPSSFEAKILKSIFADISSNFYKLEDLRKRASFDVSSRQELENPKRFISQEKEKDELTTEVQNVTELEGQGNGIKPKPMTPEVKLPSPLPFPKGASATQIEIKPVVPATVVKPVLPPAGRPFTEISPKPEVSLDTHPRLPPKIVIPALPNSLTLQDKLVKKIQQNFPDAEVKKVNKDNYLDIFIPSVYPKRGAHLFFNTSKNEIKIGFYCRDEDFLKKVLGMQPTLEGYSQGIRPKGNSSYTSVDEASLATIDFLSKISGKLAFQAHQKNDVNKVTAPIILVPKNKVPPPPPPPPPIKKK